jgi:hypothetical protein
MLRKSRRNPVQEWRNARESYQRRLDAILANPNANASAMSISVLQARVAELDALIAQASGSSSHRAMRDASRH